MKTISTKTFLLLSLFFSVFENTEAQIPRWDWAIGIGCINSDGANSIGHDKFGNVYVSGYFGGPIDFDPGPGIFQLYANGCCDAFISKYDSLGNFVWAKHLAHASNNIKLTVDSEGTTYITGTFATTLYFGNIPSLISGGTFDFDIFIAKLDNNGNFVWAKKFSGPMDENDPSITIDRNGDLYLTGEFGGTVDFDPGIGIHNLTASTVAYDFFISKLDSSGNFVWARQFGPAILGFSQYYLPIVSDINNDIYVTGFFEDTIDFDPGPDTFNLSSAGGKDIFLTKLDSAGNFIWAKSIGGPSHDFGFDVNVDNTGNVYTTGIFSGNVDFDPNAGVFILGNVFGGSFVSKLDSSGNFVWAKELLFAVATAIVSDSLNNVYIGGRFIDTVDFDPNPLFSFLLTSTSLFSDIFIVKLDSLGNFIWAKSAGGYDADFFSDLTVTSSGVTYITGNFGDTITFDSTLITNNLSSSSFFVTKLSCETYMTINPVACNSFISPSGNYTWTSSGTYLDTIFNISACYTLYTVHLTIGTVNTTSTQTINTCSSYISPSGNYTWNISGTYVDTIPNAGACDSIMTINLTINTVNNTVSQNGITLTANAAGAKYQWLDCNNGFAPLISDTNQLFTATVNGNYAVAILQNGCIDTSTCYAITNVSINEMSASNNFAVFPDPVKNSCTVIALNFTNAILFIYDITGRTMLQQPFNSKAIIDVSKLSKGVYIAEIKDRQGRSVKGKVVKE